MTLQDIWNQALADKNNSFFIGNDSLFTIQNGCKIERFNNGEIVIKNTRLGGDFYKKLTQSEYSVFEQDGWHLGTQYVELQTYKYQVDALNRIIQHRLNASQDATRFQEQRTNILKKIHENPYSKTNPASGETDIVPLTSTDA
jgi:hypothetical protein